MSFDPREPAGLARDKKAAYIKRYDRPGTEGGWHFLTGDEESIAPLMASLGYQYAYDAAIDQYAHAAALVVLTSDGRISRYFLGIEFSARDLRFGLIDASAGRIGSAIERAVITWCYHYDPKTGKYGLIIDAPRAGRRHPDRPGAGWRSGRSCGGGSTRTDVGTRSPRVRTRYAVQRPLLPATRPPPAPPASTTSTSSSWR